MGGFYKMSATEEKPWGVGRSIAFFVGFAMVVSAGVYFGLRLLGVL